MDIRSTHGEGTARLGLHGELDIGPPPKLDAAADRASPEGPRDVVLGLGGTTFMDSTGLNALIRAARAVDARRGTMAVLSPPGSEARVVIEMSRTGSVVGLRDAD